MVALTERLGDFVVSNAMSIAKYGVADPAIGVGLGFSYAATFGPENEIIPFALLGMCIVSAATLLRYTIGVVETYDHPKNEDLRRRADLGERIHSSQFRKNLRRDD